MIAVPAVGVYRPEVTEREGERGRYYNIPYSYYSYDTSEYGDGGGLSSSIMSQESSDLTLIHVQTQTIHC